MNMPSKQVSIQFIIGILMFIGSVFAAALFADDRYAKAQELRQFISATKKDATRAADILRKQMLEDKIFELDLVPDSQKSDVQRAMANRSKTQLQDVQSRISTTDQDQKQ